MPHNLFGWSYPPGCSGPPEDYTHWRMCKCGKSEEDHDIDENDNLLGCIESGCEEFREETDDAPVDYPLEDDDA